MQIKLLTTIFFSLCFLQGIAQDEKEHRPQLNFGLQLGFPQDNFARIYSRDAIFGMGGRLLFPLDQKLPLDAGFQFYYMWMGTEKETFTLYNAVQGDYVVTSKVHGSMMPFHINLRFRPLRNVTNVVDPYIEGLAGFRVFYVKTEIEVDDLTPTEQPEPETSTINNWSGSYGVATGLGIRIAENIKLDFRYSRLKGGKAKYLDPKKIEFSSTGDPIYSRNRSETNMDNYEIGIVFVL